MAATYTIFDKQYSALNKPQLDAALSNLGADKVKTFLDSHVDVTPSSSGVGSAKVALGGTLGSLHDAIKFENDSITRLQEQLKDHEPESAYYKDITKEIEDLKKVQKERGQAFQEGIHDLNQSVVEFDKHISEQHSARVETIKANAAADLKTMNDGIKAAGGVDKYEYHDGKQLLTGKAAEAAHKEAIRKTRDNLMHDAETEATHARSELRRVSDEFKSKGAKVTELTEVGEHVPGKGTFLTGGAAAAEKGVIGQAKWDKLGKESTFGQTKAAATANWKQSGTAMKFARGVVSAGGLYVALTSGFDLVKHAMGGTKKDDAGNEIPTTGSDIVVDAAKLAAGAGAVYLALVAGGKKAAIGSPAMG